MLKFPGMEMMVSSKNNDLAIISYDYHRTALQWTLQDCSWSNSRRHCFSWELVSH